MLAFEKIQIIIGSLCLLTLISCNTPLTDEVPTSHDTDSSLYADLNLTGSSEFISAFSVINENCIGCHYGYHDDWIAYTNESDWERVGLINPGFLSGSILYTKISLANSGGNMPDESGGIVLTTEEFETIQTWVSTP